MMETFGFHLIGHAQGWRNESLRVTIRPDQSISGQTLPSWLAVHDAFALLRSESGGIRRFTTPDGAARAAIKMWGQDDDTERTECTTEMGSSTRG